MSRNAQLMVRYAEPAELDPVHRTYAAAFADEAVASWSKLAETPEIYRALLQQALTQDEVLIAEAAEGLVGVSVWISVQSTERIHAEVEQIADLAAEQPELARTATAMRAVAARHPAAPHIFLSSMGVLPTARGRGVGGALLRNRLSRADTEQRPAYLEASTPRSRQLYARYGFSPLGAPIVLPEGGPRIQPMWREPERSADDHRA